MTSIYASASETDFSYKKVVEHLRAADFTCRNKGNTYENSRLQTRRFIEDAAREGRPYNNPEILLHRIEERELLYGPSEDVEVTCVSGEVLVGHIAGRRICLKLISPSVQTRYLVGLTDALRKAGAVMDD